MKVTLLLQRNALVRFVVLSNVILIFTLSSLNATAQSDTSFHRHGNPFALIFTDVNCTFNKDGNSKAFELTRAFLGYEYFFSKNIYARINIDLADPGVGELKLTAIIRNAFVQYKSNKFSARVGMIDVDQYSLQQAQWGYRYVYKSFQDAYKFGPPSGRMKEPERRRFRKEIVFSAKYFHKHNFADFIASP